MDAPRERTPEEKVIRVAPSSSSVRRSLADGEAKYLAAAIAKLDSLEYGDPAEFVFDRSGRAAARRSNLRELWVPPTFRTADERNVERDINALWTTTEQCAVVIGHPGYGKSTLARFLTTSFAHEFLASKLDRFAFYVPLASLKLKDRTNQRAIVECAVRAVGLVLDEGALLELEKSLKSATLIFDGLDELPMTHGAGDQIPTRIEAASLIRSVNIPNNESFRTGRLSTIVTSRVADWHEDDRTKIRPAALFEISNFSPEQAREAVVRWHDVAIRLRAEEGLGTADLEKRKLDVANAISTNSELGAVCLTPLMLNILQTIYSDESRDIPSSVSQLCLRAVDRLFMKKHLFGDQKLLITDHGSWILDALAEGAFTAQERLVQGGTKILTDEDLRRVSKNTCRLSEATPFETRENLITSIAAHIRRGHGILQPMRRNEYEFAHNVFREVLAGYALAKRPVTQRRGYALLEKWHAPIRYWAGLRAASEEGKNEINAFVGELRGGPGSRTIEAALARAEMLSEVVSVTHGQSLMRDLKQRILATQSELLKWLSRRSLPFSKRMRIGDLLGTLGDPRLEAEFSSRLFWVEAGPRQIGRSTNHITRITKYSSVPASPPIEGMLSRFALSALLVTNAEYKQFLDDGGYKQREHWQSAEGWAWASGDDDVRNAVLNRARAVAPTHLTSEVLGQRLIAEDFPDQCERMIKRSSPMYWSAPSHNRPNQPVVGVNWWEALAYASWIDARLRNEGKLDKGQQVRLPTEAEWESVARQLSGDNPYPWTEGPPYENAHLRAAENSEEARALRPCAVGLFPFNSSGLHDIVGNVWEWTLSKAKPYSQEAFRQEEDVCGLDDRVARGSSWLSSEIEAAEITFRSFDPPYNAYEDLGIRLCVAERGK
ncbi:formylglycine-generating enzyme required for sulfatase activity/energy-coupling factor transporter ATP-binding protein EcfA2 [Bradyrhizobium japonicum]